MTIETIPRLDSKEKMEFHYKLEKAPSFESSSSDHDVDFYKLLNHLTENMHLEGIESIEENIDTPDSFCDPEITPFPCQLDDIFKQASEDALKFFKDNLDFLDNVTEESLEGIDAILSKYEESN